MIGGHTMIAVTTTDLTDALTGVLKGNYDDKAIRAERAAKYESAP